jgi:nitrate reductase gamma subunit
MYEFVRGPLVWMAAILTAGGVLYKAVAMHALARKEKSVYPTLSAKFGLRSMLHWLVPFASRNMRLHWVVTIVSYTFHACLIVTPLFVMGHAVLWHESWGISWWSLPAPAADLMSILVVVCGIFLLLRRIASPEVRNVTGAREYLLLLLVIAPFLTGYIAHHQWWSPGTMVVIHIVVGCLWLVAIPFTWLSHVMWFAFSRSFMGSEFGAVRNARDW